MSSLDITRYHPPMLERNTVDTDFLSSSHFTLGQDMAVVKDAMNSVFKLTYPAHEVLSKPNSSVPPVLAEVMHKDDRFFNEKASETVTSFEYLPPCKPDLPEHYATGTSGKTNFKMDSDVSKFNSFKTTHNRYFQPLMGSDYERVRPITFPMKTCISQGDLEKEPLQVSDYRDKYRGHDTTLIRVLKAPCQHAGCPPTVKGDNRLGNFKTTNMDIFQGQWSAPVQTLPAPTGTNVPQGDKEKVSTKSTTMWDSYPDCFRDSHYHYKPDDVSAQLRKTNFKQSDGHFVWNDFQSTAMNSYHPKHVKVERPRPGFHRNHSDLPPGDHDAERAAQRISSTTSKFHFGSPALNHINPIKSGAFVRTNSNVWFGEPRMKESFYDTTMEKTFRAITVPYIPIKAGSVTTSSVPIDYYKNPEVNQATTSQDYRNPKQERLVLNPKVIQYLSHSHIFPPLGNVRQFNTTHKDIFVPKSTSRYTYDSQRLQISSVPLGTLTKRDN